MLHCPFVLISSGSSSETGESVWTLYKRQKGGIEKLLRTHLGNIFVRSMFRILVCPRRHSGALFGGGNQDFRYPERLSVKGGIQKYCLPRKAFRSTVD